MDSTLPYVLLILLERSKPNLAIGDNDFEMKALDCKRMSLGDSSAAEHVVAETTLQWLQDEPFQQDNLTLLIQGRWMNMKSNALRTAEHVTWKRSFSAVDAECAIVFLRSNSNEYASSSTQIFTIEEWDDAHLSLRQLVALQKQKTSKPWLYEDVHIPEVHQQYWTRPLQLKPSPLSIATAMNHLSSSHLCDTCVDQQRKTMEEEEGKGMRFTNAFVKRALRMDECLMRKQCWPNMIGMLRTQGFQVDDGDSTSCLCFGEECQEAFLSNQLTNTEKPATNNATMETALDREEDEDTDARDDRRLIADVLSVVHVANIVTHKSAALNGDAGNSSTLYTNQHSALIVFAKKSLNANSLGVAVVRSVCLLMKRLSIPKGHVISPPKQPYSTDAKTICREKFPELDMQLWTSQQFAFDWDGSALNSPAVVLPSTSLAGRPFCAVALDAASLENQRRCVLGDLYASQQRLTKMSATDMFTRRFALSDGDILHVQESHPKPTKFIRILHGGSNHSTPVAEV